METGKRESAVPQGLLIARVLLQHPIRKRECFRIPVPAQGQDGTIDEHGRFLPGLLQIAARAFQVAEQKVGHAEAVEISSALERRESGLHPGRLVLGSALAQSAFVAEGAVRVQVGIRETSLDVTMR